MRPSRIKAKLERNAPVLVTTLHFTDPSVFELTSLLGFDGIWMDMEHHSYGLETGAALMRAARVGVSDIIARPAKGEFMRMQRMLEAGAQGIMYPRCDDAEEAAEVVAWAKFPPLGKRGCDFFNPDAPYGMMTLDEYLEEANRQTFVVVQIEQPHTVEEVERIAQVDGVDVLMMGPGDLSIQYGIPGQMDHPLMRNAIERVAGAARAAGKHWGCPAATVELTRELMEMGARFICHQADILLVKSGLERVRQQFSPLGFSFEVTPEQRAAIDEERL
jgi:4-hydroxy-2-oxoheptanedioate aldolase